MRETWATLRELLLPDGASLDATRPRRHLETQLRTAITSGRLVPGTRLPSTRDLARQLNVSRGTTLAVYEQLVAEGYLESKRGSATRVTFGGVPRPPYPAPGETPPPFKEQVVHCDLDPGFPSLSAFPRNAWLAAYRAGLSALTDADLGYPPPAGLLSLRREVASYLGRVRSMPTSADDLVITGGTFDALAVIADCLREAGHSTIAVEDPSNPHLLRMFTTHGLEPVPIAVDEEGLDVSRLDRSGCRAVLVTPAHQYPLGVQLSPRRRRALIDWAIKGDCLVIEDDYDAEYRYDRAALGALRTLAPTVVAYLGTLSKTLAPGLRIGWLAAPAWLCASVRNRKHLGDRGDNVITQAAVREFLGTGGYDRHLRSTRLQYRRLRENLLESVSTHLPDCTPIGIEAGLHVVIRLPENEQDSTLVEHLATAGIRVAALTAYRHHHSGFPGLVLGWAQARPNQLATSIQTLAGIRRTLASERRIPAARPGLRDSPKTL